MKEIAFSGAVVLKNLLLGLGACVYAEDPFYTKDELNELGFIGADLSFKDCDDRSWLASGNWIFIFLGMF